MDEQRKKKTDCQIQQEQRKDAWRIRQSLEAREVQDLVLAAEK